MKDWLKSLGKMSKADLHQSEVPSQLQTYAAKFVMDGCKKIGLAFIEIILTESGKNSTSSLKMNLRSVSQKSTNTF